MDAPQPPPRVLLVLSEHWRRALLRAELLERGFDAVGAADLGDALDYPAEEPDRGPVRAIVVGEDAVGREQAPFLDRLLRQHHAPPVLLIASRLVAVPRGPWSRVLYRPVSVEEIIGEIERLLRTSIPDETRTFHPQQ